MSTQDRRRMLAARIESGDAPTHEDVAELRRLIAVMERRQRFSIGRAAVLLVVVVAIVLAFFVIVMGLNDWRESSESYNRYVAD